MTSVLATGDLAARAPKVGACAALKEGLGSAHFLRNYLEPELPERFAELERQLAASPCRLVRLRRAWTNRESATQLPATSRAFCVANPESDLCEGPELPLALVPFSRSFIANTLLAIATPNWFRQYDRLATPDAP
jgi:hypothetical protein